MTATRTLSRAARTPVVLVIAGAGGHLEQARRVVSHLDLPDSAQASCALLTDHDRDEAAPFDSVYSIPTPAPKHRKPTARDRFDYVVGVVRFVRSIRRRYRVRVVIVTGPGFAFLPALWFKLTGATLIVFESWSRFERRSKCSQVLYPISDRFLVQHKELLAIYPRAIWVGLL